MASDTNDDECGEAEFAGEQEGCEYGVSWCMGVVRDWDIGGIWAGAARKVGRASRESRSREDGDDTNTTASEYGFDTRCVR